MGFFAKSSMLVLAFLWAGVSNAHEIKPAVADVFIKGDIFEVEIYLTAETLLAGIDISSIANTNDSPQSAEYDDLRLLSEADLAAKLRADWPVLAQSFTLQGAGPLRLIDVEVFPEINLSLPRDTKLVLQADIDRIAQAVAFGWAKQNGTLVVRYADKEDLFATILNNGELSPPLPRVGRISQTWMQVFGRYVIEGFEHIFPKGRDHILFVLGLFLFSLSMRPLLAQITTFTLAHTVTLAMATLGVINIPAGAVWIVESLIAASIVYVGVENILRPRLSWLRIVIVFVFGLLHGLGFASVLGDLGLSLGHFVPSLIGFNVGVELGQLAVVAVAYIAFGLTLGGTALYRKLVVIPGSLMISAVGMYWIIERTIL